MLITVQPCTVVSWLAIIFSGTTKFHRHLSIVVPQTTTFPKTQTSSVHSSTCTYTCCSNYTVHVTAQDGDRPGLPARTVANARSQLAQGHFYRSAINVYVIGACTCTCNSCLMVWNMYRARASRAEPEEVHTARGRYYPMHCRNNETADLYR